MSLEAGTARQNVELKARLSNLAVAKTVCNDIGAESRGDIHQVDVYFRVPEGRLKLRINEPGGAELVRYRRPDLEGPKTSLYTVEPVSDSLAQMLRESLDAWCVVDKVRTLYLWRNVRIHLDTVEGLGLFIEFEAVLSSMCDVDEGRRRVDWLTSAFALADDDLVPVGYSDLLDAPQQA